MMKKILETALLNLAKSARSLMLVLGLLTLTYSGSVAAQNYGPEQSICWNNWGNFDRIRVRFESTNVNSDYDSNLTVNGTTIASVGRNPWNGNSYSGETYVYKPIGISLGWQFVGGPWWGGYNPSINYSCNPTFEDAGISPIEGTFYFYGSYLTKSNITVSKSATPYTLQAGASGQYYTIAVGISTAATTVPTYIYDSLPAGITTSDAITASGGSVQGCPAPGASSLSGCYIPAGASGTVYIKVPINVANSTASSVSNTAYAYNTGSANCTSTTSCSGSSTNPVSPNLPTLFISQSVNANVTTSGPWSFTYSGNNGVGSPTLSSTATGAAFVNSATYTLTAAGTATAIQLNAPGGWYVTGAYCQDTNYAVTGNPSGVLGDGTGNTWGSYTVTLAAANVRAGSAFQCFAAYSKSSFRLIKTLSGSRANANDQFTVQLLAGSTLEISSTTTGTGSTVTAGSGDTGERTVNSGLHTIQEVAANGTDLSQYSTTVSCSNAATAGTVVSSINKLGDSITTKDGDDITCRIKNEVLPKLVITQSVSANVSTPGPWNFTYSGSNGVGSPTLSSVATGASLVNSATYTLTAAGTDTTVQLNAPGGWYVINAYCTDNNYASSGNPSGSLGTVSGSTWGRYAVTIPAANVRAGSALQCFATYSQSSFRLIKSLSGSRVNPNDQFTVQLLAGSTLEISSTTTGTGSTVTPGTGDTGAKTVNSGSHTVQEAASNGTNLSQYSTTISCSNAATASDSTSVSSVRKLGDSVTTKDGDAITCTLQNTAISSLSLSKKLGGAGRANAADQFALAIKTGGVSGTTVASVTTTGTGSTATGTASLNPAVSGTTYTLTEVGSSVTRLNQYNSGLTCTDTAGVQTGLPNGVAFDPDVGYAITPQAGAQISCTLTNTPKTSSLSLNKALGAAGRSNPSDQFTLVIKTGGASGTSVASVTTTGTGITAMGTANVNPAAATAYTLTEAGAYGAVLAQYNSTLTCMDSAGFQTGLPNGAAFDQSAGYTLTPVAGAQISCTVSNIPKPANLTLTQVIADGSVPSPFVFSYSVDNSWGTAQISNPSVGYPGVKSETRPLGTVGQDTVITVNLKPGWRLIPSDTLCGDGNGGYTGNGGSNFGAISNNTLRIPAANVKNFSELNCTIGLQLAPPTINVIKSLGSNSRIASSDQFTVQIKNSSGSVLNGTTTSTTQGSGSTISPNTGVTGQTIVTAGVSHNINEVMASGSSSSLAQYVGTLACTNDGANAFKTVLPSALAANFTPNAGDVINCTVTNTLKTSSLSLSKAFGGTGRVSAADQFVLAIKTGGGSGTAAASVTTTGTGTIASGTASVNSLVAGTAYTLTEAGASGATLARYGSTLTCTDSAGFQTGLPAGVAFTPSVGYTLTPVAGAQISCTVTNTPLAATLMVSQTLSPTVHQYPIVVTYTANNGWVLRQLSSTANSEVLTDVQSLTGLGVGMQFNLTFPNNRWVMSGVSCTDTNAAISGNPTTVFGNVVSTSSFTIDASILRAGARLKCAVSLFAPRPY